MVVYTYVVDYGGGMPLKDFPYLSLLVYRSTTQKRGH